jgi:hypothetical protein
MHGGEEIASVTTVETSPLAGRGDDIRRGPSKAHPAPNNVGVALLLAVVLLVVGAVALVGVPAVGKLRQQSGCAATMSQPVARPDCGV